MTTVRLASRSGLSHHGTEGRRLPGAWPSTPRPAEQGSARRPGPRRPQQGWHRAWPPGSLLVAWKATFPDPWPAPPPFRELRKWGQPDSPGRAPFLPVVGAGKQGNSPPDGAATGHWAPALQVGDLDLAGEQGRGTRRFAFVFVFSLGYPGLQSWQGDGGLQVQAGGSMSGGQRCSSGRWDWMAGGRRAERPADLGWGEGPPSDRSAGGWKRVGVWAPLPGPS